MQFTFPWRQARGTIAAMDEARGPNWANECLAGMGYATGLEGAVRRYLAYVEARRDLALQWRPDPTQSAALVGERAVHPGGQFFLEVGASGLGRLVHLWPGWGRRTIGTGSPDQLRSDALRMLRAGGPFGGPTTARTGERIVQLTGLHGGVRRPLPDGSEVRLHHLEETSLRVRIWPDGKFAQVPATGTPDDDGKMIEDDAEHVRIGSTQTPWIFTDLHPLLGSIRVPPYHLLLCPITAELVAVIGLGVAGHGHMVGRWAEIRALDFVPWLELLTADLAQEEAKAAARAEEKAARESTPSAKAAGVSAKTSTKAAAPPPAADRERPSDEATADKPAPKKRQPAATSPGGMPGRRERRVRLKPALAEAVTRHLASVASGLPAGVLGAAFAVELLRALEAAVLSDQPTWTGKTIDLFARLHKKGFLSSVPADQAGRAALKLLADRTPLVRRLHYRRWCFAFGDIHELASTLRGRLGVIAAE